MKRNKGFTFIELLITLAVIAICFLPLMRMFTVSMDQAAMSGDLTTARYLAQEGMEIVKNSGLTEIQLARNGMIVHPALDKPPLFYNGKSWRVARKPVVGTDPLEVRIEVFLVTPGKEEMKKPLLSLVTFFEDLDWGGTEGGL